MGLGRRLLRGIHGGASGDPPPTDTPSRLLLEQWDLVAGCSVGFMVVPQAIAYANSAGLPSVMGLYGAFLPCIVYAVFGTSRCARRKHLLGSHSVPTV